MQLITVAPGDPIEKLDQKKLFRLRDYLVAEHQRIFDNRVPLERAWRRLLHMYQGRPQLDIRNIPYENCPNLEITIGALASDAIYAQMVDLIFSTNPVMTIRSKGKKWDAVAAGLQTYVDHGVNRAFNFKPSAKHALLDCVQLGDMSFYIPWMQTVRQTYRATITDLGPLIYPIPVEDFLMMSNSYGDVQRDKFVTMRLWMSKDELQLRKKQSKWKISEAKESEDKVDPVRKERLAMSGVDAGGLSRGSFQVLDTFILFDIFDDKVQRELEVVWDWTGKTILKLQYNQNDYRPFSRGVYQERAHVANGMGVLEPTEPFEREITEVHMARVTNMLLANTRGYIGPEGARSEVTVVTPGMYISTFGGEITPFKMADIYPSSAQAEALTLSLAERRVGVNELTQPQRVGGRTPATTAMSVMQQANRRFATAFDNVRTTLAGTVEQCIYRLQEQIKRGNQNAIEMLRKVILDDEEYRATYEFLYSEEIDLLNVAEIEMTAASVSINREADRQNMMLMGQMFEKYVQGMFQLEQMKQANPDLAQQAEKALNVIFKRVFRTFDQISDVKSVLLTPSEQDMMQQAGLQDLMQQMSGGGPEGGGGGGPTEGIKQGGGQRGGRF
jgi:hypothetical protein